MPDSPQEISMDCPERLQLCVLASGSGGNCTLLRTPAGTMLIDIGIGPRTFGRRVAMTGSSFSPQQINAVCLTHLDSDHFNTNWFKTLERFQIPLYCHAGVVERVEARAPGVVVRSFDCDSSFEPIEGLRFDAISCAHDETGSHGFVIDGFSTRIGYATDLGHVPGEMLDAFCDLDLLCIESNYDRQMQIDSDRPWFLKQRVMGGKGHLSNDQAYQAVVQMLNRCEAAGRQMPRHIVLLHRSRECNCPDRLRDHFSRDARIARRLTLAEQFEPTCWLAPGAVAGDQMMLAW
jgi:phosphoribosyl 1,2-cyclic phosphodiesterase